MEAEPHRHGNPYANIKQADGDRSGGVNIEHAPNSEAVRIEEGDYSFFERLAGRSGNPHANIAEGDERQPYSYPLPRLDSAEGLPKVEFRTICRTVFARYIPAAEHGRLRPHHREFIARNESRSPRVRLLLANALRRYDLSDTAGLVSQFNRGEREFTEEKLKFIEETVLREAGE